MRVYARESRLIGRLFSYIFSILFQCIFRRSFSLQAILTFFLCRYRSELGGEKSRFASSFVHFPK